ncbi:PepSY domain-containing protein [Olivibacter sp. SDN3]|uniref:PepSY-associated TM helix domain-containing protein n=1 Tax=Olivibacter sp. SDN3 TaxID=2764720 RepID=UPI0016515F11|nr:PepSY-associated TM helix domain-containing protein [Olivibacter sp. SDN3]QNL52010.1 PepSY domain-containing protein [Olivibacter sp. SDN3]
MSFKKKKIFKKNVLNRKIHYWGSILISFPFLLILVTGILLLLKKDVAWIQPETQKSEDTRLLISFEDMLSQLQTIEVLSIESWIDVSRIDIQPDKGIAKITTQNSYEIQLSLSSGDVLQVAYRRSDLIESLHDGSFFHDKAKYFYSLPTAITLLLSLVTGIILFLQPILAKRRRQRKTSNN